MSDMQSNIDTPFENAIIFYNDGVLLRNQSIFWSSEIFPSLEDNMIRKINLGSIHFIELISLETINLFLRKDSQWMTVREALNVIDKEHFGMLIKGLSLLRWDKHHQFCGKCAKKTILTSQLFERHCSDCKINYYPRISPAIIVLIHREDHVLLARGAHFPPGVYGLVAGFVEVGETLEETVHREVREEVGIQIKNLSYYGSQPWPFPDSLMIGFTAEYESGQILIDHRELEDAGWYRYDQLPGLPPISISIAFQMINQFKNNF
jgi:NAD+ diphosphatase